MVRIITEGQEKTDYKVFEHKSAAMERFHAGWLRTDDGEFESIAVFQVTGTRYALEAVEAVKSADQSKVTLLELKESRDKELSKWAKSMNLDLKL